MKDYFRFFLAACYTLIVFNIEYFGEKIKSIKQILDKRDIFIALVIIFSSMASFGLGRLSKMEENREPITTQYEDTQKSGDLSVGDESGIGTERAEGVYMASKNGSKYYLPTCGGAQRIAEANRVWFNSKEEAESAGYLPSTSCEGM